jgi:TnpA family transposase
VPDLDLGNRRARARVKGGHVRPLHFQTGAARLLARLTAGREAGPEATNTGLKPVINEGREALRRGRLFWVEQNYVRDECCSRATARMVAFHAAQPIVANWGGGELASADGLRFVTPVRTINSRPNPMYLGPGARRGVTFYNFLFDMYAGFNGIIVPGTQRDSLYILDGLLEQDSGIRPAEVTSDTHGASEIVFGLFRLMGYRFSPRLADAGSATLYRIDPEADYGELNSLTRDRIRVDRIKNNWDDILRLAASLRTGTVKASEILRVLTPGGRPTTLGKAIMEIGRLDRSAFLAMYFNDAIFRRKVNRQLNRQESRHQLARRIYHGQKGEMRKKYREGQEDQLGALGLGPECGRAVEHRLHPEDRRGAAGRGPPHPRGGHRANLPAGLRPHQFPRPIQLRSARRSYGRRAAAHAQAPCGPHRPLASGGIGIFLGRLCKSPSHLLVRHPSVAGDTAKTPAFLNSRHHRRDHRGIDHGVETLAQSDDEPEPLRGGQSAETITEPRRQLAESRSSDPHPPAQDADAALRCQKL